MLNSTLRRLTVAHQLRKIPLRTVNHRASHATVIENCASWLCVCGNPVALQGRSGALSGPTAESASLCPECERLYFVIPHDRSYRPPVEVVELLRLPQTERELAPERQH